ncbi:MAG: GyrI-like domain-containing protein [Xanthobacteraceae bacterium]
MPFRLARAGVAGVALTAILLAAILGRGLSQAAFAQSPGPAPAQTQPPNPAPAPPAAATTPAAPAAPEQIAPGATPAQPGDVFGENTMLTARPMIYVKGSGTWDKTFDIITTSLKRIKAYLDKGGIKADGLPMTIFTASDDNGFDYEIGVPIATALKNPPHGEFALGQTPDGAALKFVYRGSYDDLDNTYETITDYLDEKRLDAKEMIEEYVTDPLSGDAGKLVVNVYVLIKPPDASPG